MSELTGCGSHSCIVKKPEGMGTNGPCRCADWRGQRYINQLRARLTDTERNLDEAAYEIESLQAREADTDLLLKEAQERADKAEAEVARLRNTFTRLRAEKLEYWMERCERLEAESNQRLQLLQAAKCPACDGSGAIPHGPTLDGGWELEECQWCYERNAELTPEPDEMTQAMQEGKL